MEKNNNITNTPIGIWYIEGNEACRRREDGSILRVKKEKDYEDQIKKQDEALKLFEAFQMMPNNDINIIGYLHTILNNSLDYLDTQNKKQLIIRMEEIKNSDYLDETNKTLLNYLITSLNENKINVYLEVLEEFKNYNASYLVEPLTETNFNGHRR